MSKDKFQTPYWDTKGSKWLELSLTCLILRSKNENTCTCMFTRFNQRGRSLGGYLIRTSTTLAAHSKLYHLFTCLSVIKLTVQTNLTDLHLKCIHFHEFNTSIDINSKICPAVSSRLAWYSPFQFREVYL